MGKSFRCLPVVMVVVLARLMPSTGMALADASAKRPKIVFILADDMRPDCIGALAHGVVKTPHLPATGYTGWTFKNSAGRPEPEKGVQRGAGFSCTAAIDHEAWS